ncbi:MAG: hypothetical protein KF901_33545 [Myxococcales bacterium]|nr:hypothetical protein [Myxococcales bacterium]
MRHLGTSFGFLVIVGSLGFVAPTRAQEPAVVEVAPQQVTGRRQRPLQVLLPPPRNVYARTERTRPAAGASRTPRALPTPSP